MAKISRMTTRTGMHYTVYGDEDAAISLADQLGATDDIYSYEVSPQNGGWVVNVYDEDRLMLGPL